MRKAKIILIVSMIFASLILFEDQVMIRRLEHANFSPLADLFKARVGEVLTAPVRGSIDLDDAKLLDTYKRATEVIRAAAAIKLKDGFPISSAELKALPPEARLDGWGRPFCLARVGGRIAAISQGPHAEKPLTCKINDEALSLISDRPSGKLYQYPSGLLVLLGGGPDYRS
ncbi:MAG TPA: hypothetical protein VJR23_01975 [Candidatus Acidoferrales bacterium]|nr:hypothetical protein [Candidatus Acidoferrales bacterium]